MVDFNFVVNYKEGRIVQFFGTDEEKGLIAELAFSVNDGRFLIGVSDDSIVELMEMNSAYKDSYNNSENTVLYSFMKLPNSKENAYLIHLDTSILESKFKHKIKILDFSFRAECCKTDLKTIKDNELTYFSFYSKSGRVLYSLELYIDHDTDELVVVSYPSCKIKRFYLNSRVSRFKDTTKTVYIGQGIEITYTSHIVKETLSVSVTASLYHNDCGGYMSQHKQ